MLVVSDASPLNVLIRTSLIGILPALYRKIIVPSAVGSEMSHPAAPQSVRDFIGAPPAWVEVRTPSKLLVLAGLDAGERAAISLATEISADLLLIDEKRGRRAARDLHLRMIGTIGMLELAALRGLIDLEESLKNIRATDFSVSDEIIHAALARNADRLQSDH
jgi:predicted nucleic acid-binding protein